MKKYSKIVTSLSLVAVLAVSSTAPLFAATREEDLIEGVPNPPANYMGSGLTNDYNPTGIPEVDQFILENECTVVTVAVSTEGLDSVQGLEEKPSFDVGVEMYSEVDYSCEGLERTYIYLDNTDGNYEEVSIEEFDTIAGTDLVTENWVVQENQDALTSSTYLSSDNTPTNVKKEMQDDFTEEKEVSYEDKGLFQSVFDSFFNFKK